ncbi:MAG: 4Fe-4S binding protein [Treponema sp.]|jgi:polyferredoxin|nr:4Fe-4S binding protein [Treponema sp.]
MQIFFAGLRHGISLYVIGFLLMAGVVFGRFICAFACPMGLLQDILYRIKTPKLVRRLRFLRYAKYAALALFVVILPLTVMDELSGLGQPWFCKYICPSGTVFGAIPLLSANGFLRRFIGVQFVLKLAAAVGVTTAAVFVYRFFCRALCPLGAIYALLNKISVLHLHYDRAKCLSCGNCAKACQLMIDPASRINSPECVRCGKCVNVCAHNALTCKMRERR